MPETSQQEHGVFARRAQDGESKPDFHATAAFLCLGRTAFFNYKDIGLIVSPSLWIEGCSGRIGSITSVPKQWYKDGIETIITLV